VSSVVAIRVPDDIYERLRKVTGRRADGSELTMSAVFLRGVVPVIETLEQANSKLSDPELLMRKDANNARALRKR
jgi:hypothetical protein